ncbi:hypothetical protein B0H10DRAFT_978602 [Mycena sp. CBHHK59/15]|nr:hypothetical protein B0H10DRAFT_978602 [Mycena sp. CBHHK59/15]
MPTVGSFPGLRQLLSPSSPLTTLVIRNFLPKVLDMPEGCIETPTIRSLAVDIRAPFHYQYISSSGFEAFMQAFTMPNLEYLEIVGGFTGSDAEEACIRVPADWEAPTYGRSVWKNRNITRLLLIYTTGNKHLLSPSGADAPWPFLRSLTIETCSRIVDPGWLSSFFAMRAGLGADMRIYNLTLSSRSAGVSLPSPVPEIRWLRDGPSHGCSGEHGFFMDDFDMREKDFEYVEPPAWFLSCGYSDCDWGLWYYESMAEIAEEFKITGELVRARGVVKEKRRQRRKSFEEGGVGARLKVATKITWWILGHEKRRLSNVAPLFLC